MSFERTPKDLSNSARPLHEIIASDIFRVGMIIIVFLEAQNFQVQLGALFYNVPTILEYFTTTKRKQKNSRSEPFPV